MMRCSVRVQPGRRRGKAPIVRCASGQARELTMPPMKAATAMIQHAPHTTRRHLADRRPPGFARERITAAVPVTRAATPSTQRSPAPMFDPTARWPYHDDGTEEASTATAPPTTAISGHREAVLGASTVRVTFRILPWGRRQIRVIAVPMFTPSMRLSCSPGRCVRRSGRSLSNRRRIDLLLLLSLLGSPPGSGRSSAASFPSHAERLGRRPDRLRPSRRARVTTCRIMTGVALI